MDILPEMKKAGYNFIGVRGGRLLFHRADGAETGTRQFKTWDEVREFCDESHETYALTELIDLDIDSWVEGISAMCAMDEIRKEAYNMAGMVEDDDNPVCPGEMEDEYTAIADRYEFRFDRRGRIVSFDLTKKQH